MLALREPALVQSNNPEDGRKSMNSSIISFPKPVLTRALSISFFAACAVLSPDGQEREAWAAVGTQEVVLEQEIQEVVLEQEIEAQEMKIKQVFETEKVDPEWSQRAETSWTQIFQQEVVKEELKGVQLRNIKCRTTLCRVELTPTDPAQGAAAFEEDVGKLILFAPWQGSASAGSKIPTGRLL
jgi:hypothetical protein